MSLLQEIIKDLPALESCKDTGKPKTSKKLAFTDYKLTQCEIIASAMIKNRTVNLNKCRGTVMAERGILMDSAHQYLCRFFKTGKHEDLNALFFAIIIRLLGKLPDAYYAIDRTEWKHGTRWYNFLVIGIVVNGVLIPLITKDLGERKSSSTTERIELWRDFEHLMKWLNDGVMPKVYLCGDREFGNAEWISFLLEKGISFILRAKSGNKWDIWHNATYRNKPVKLKTLVRYSRWTGITKFELITKDTNTIIYLHIKHLAQAPQGQEQFLCILSDIETADDVFTFYKFRWKIESCFKNLKTNGFGLEKLNLLPVIKTETLFMLLSMIYAVMIMEGIYQASMPTYKNRQKSKDSNYPKQALFTFAAEIVKVTMDSRKQFVERLLFLIKFTETYKLHFQVLTI